MFICNDGKKDVHWIPIAVRKGTKKMDLDRDYWSLIEQTFRRAVEPPLSSPTTSVGGENG